MSLRNRILPVLAGTFVAVVTLASEGSRNPLLADDTGDCIIGGSGVLCYTRTTQTCVSWGLSSWSFEMTFGMTTTCTEWVTQTDSYYRDPTGDGTKIGVK